MHKINHHRRKWTSDLCVKRPGNSWSPRYPSCVHELAVYWRDSHHYSFYWKVVRRQKTLADRTSGPLEPGILVLTLPLPLTSHVSFWESLKPPYPHTQYGLLLRSLGSSHLQRNQNGTEPQEITLFLVIIIVIFLVWYFLLNFSFNNIGSSYVHGCGFHILFLESRMNGL